jgi:DNA-binding transcriptional MerR regulator
MRERQDTKIYYSISEASAIAKVKPHVLRYWETQFKMLRPKKNKAGNRMYRKRDLKLIQLIKELLYEKGFTIAGARRKLLDERAALREQLELRFSEVDRSTMLLEVIRELKEVLRDLRGGALPSVELPEDEVPAEEGALEETAGRHDGDRDLDAGVQDSGPDGFSDDDEGDEAAEAPGRMARSKRAEL